MSDNLELINNMEVVESSASGGELEYVYVSNSRENRKILNELGVSDIEIDEWTFGSDVIDISMFGFVHAGAKWFDKSKGGFLNYVPDDVPEWCK